MKDSSWDLVKEMMDQYEKNTVAVLVDEVRRLVSEGVLEILMQKPAISSHVERLGDSCVVTMTGALGLRLAAGYGKLSPPVGTSGVTAHIKVLEDTVKLHRENYIEVAVQRDRLLEKVSHYEKVLEELHLYAVGLKEVKKT